MPLSLPFVLMRSSFTVRKTPVGRSLNSPFSSVCSFPSLQLVSTKISFLGRAKFTNDLESLIRAYTAKSQNVSSVETLSLREDGYVERD